MVRTIYRLYNYYCILIFRESNPHVGSYVEGVQFDHGFTNSGFDFSFGFKEEKINLKNIYHKEGTQPTVSRSTTEIADQ